MSINTSQRAGWGTELTANMSGSPVLIGTLTHNPVMMIFDNQSTNAITISVDDPTGGTVWRTFTAGEALTIDFRSNHGIAANWTPDLGTSFYGNGSSGTFSISYLFALTT
jgi:hypothetical protein